MKEKTVHRGDDRKDKREDYMRLVVDRLELLDAIRYIVKEEIEKSLDARMNEKGGTPPKKGE